MGCFVGLEQERGPVGLHGCGGRPPSSPLPPLGEPPQAEEATTKRRRRRRQRQRRRGHLAVSTSELRSGNPTFYSGRRHRLLAVLLVLIPRLPEDGGVSGDVLLLLRCALLSPVRIPAAPDPPLHQRALPTVCNMEDWSRQKTAWMHRYLFCHEFAFRTQGVHTYQCP